MSPSDQGWTRRQVGIGAAGVLAAVALPGCGGGSDTPTDPVPVDTPPETSDVGFFDPTEEATLRSMLDTLIPGGDGLPSADEAHVFVYIERELSKPDFEGIGREIQKGLKQMDALAQRGGGAPFTDVPDADKRAILGGLQTGKAKTPGYDGSRFFQMVFTLALEGYLGHPRHGGNPGGITWKAVGLTWHDHR